MADVLAAAAAATLANSVPTLGSVDEFGSELDVIVNAVREPAELMRTVLAAAKAEAKDCEPTALA